MPLITRRTVLQGCAASIAVATGECSAAAEEAGRRARFVLVFLKGGLDGLAAVPPLGDARYAETRGALAVRRDRKPVDLDGCFGLHPALGLLAPHYRRSELLIVAGCGTAGVQPSHAAAQAALFGGTSDTAASIWMERLAMSAELRSRVTADASSDEAILYDTGRCDCGLDMAADLLLANPTLHAAFGSAHDGEGALPDRLGRRFAAERARFRLAATATGVRLSTPDGPRLALLELAGFDTHVGQGGEAGRLALTLSALSDGLVALAEHLGPAWRHTVVLAVTEFGRSVATNRFGGTDHGTASVALLMGGAVAGGRVIGDWPGLEQRSGYGGAGLAVTSDTRAVLASVLLDHLRLSKSDVSHLTTATSSLPPVGGLIA